MLAESVNDKFVIIRKDKNPNSLFASFRVFKTIGHGGLYTREERPPYPIIISEPYVSDVFYNINKSDVLVGSLFIFAGFFGTIYATRRFRLLADKFIITKYFMWYYTLFGSFVAMCCSYYRLIGFMENGLRWKRRDLLYSKYDFTRDFEDATIFKYFRERLD